MKTKKLSISIGVVICVLIFVLVSCNKQTLPVIPENSSQMTFSEIAETTTEKVSLDGTTGLAADFSHSAEASQNEPDMTSIAEAETETTQSDKTTKPTESEKSSVKVTEGPAVIQKPSSSQTQTKPAITTTKPTMPRPTEPVTTTKQPVATTQATTKPAAPTTTKPAATTTTTTKPAATTTTTTKPAETTTTTTKPPTTTTTTTQDPKVKYLDSKLLFVGEEYLWGEEDDGTKIYVRGTLHKTGKKANDTINQAALAKINRYRQSQGLNTLTRNTAVQSKADRAASIIAARHVQFSLVGHVYSGYDAALTYIITYDMNNKEIGELAAEAFIQSPPHAEILREKGTKISVATWIYDEPMYGETIALIISIK